MQISAGENRLVVVLPLLHIVIKFPIIRLVVALRSLFNELFQHPRLLKSEMLSYTPETYGSLKRLLFKGILDNWREFIFYQTSKHAMLQPTYFSLFGLCNVQAYAAPYTGDDAQLWKQFYTLSAGAAFRDSHHFAYAGNFAVVQGKLRILDYGGKKTQSVIKDFGKLFWEQLDLTKVPERTTPL